MKSAIRTFAAFVLLGSAFGCARGAKMATITPPDGSTFSKPAPVSKSEGPSSSDEIIAPKAETPPAPVTPTDPTTPPAAPTTPKAPETTPPPSGSKPSGGTSPITIDFKPGLAPIPYAPPPTPAVKTSVALSDPEAISCEGCAGGEGDSKIFQCPDNYVVTGFETASATSGTYSAEDGTPSYSDFTTTALKIKCSPVTDLNISPDKTEFASVPSTGETQAGSSDATPSDLDDPIHPMIRPASCPIYSGAANGVVGRLDGKLDTFGLTCASYYRSGPSVNFLSTSGRTSANADITVGSEFTQKCPEDTALVGLQIRYDSDKVLGVDSLLCAGPSLLTYSPFTVPGK